MASTSRIKVFLALVLALLSVAGCASIPAAQDKTASDHFNGTHFYNKLPSEKSISDILLLGIQYPFIKKSWPVWVDDEADILGKGTINTSPVVVTVINHATVLIQIDGVNILTDPIYSDRASPFSWIGPHRIRKPAISLEELPSIDVILISHDHYDHLDISTLKNICKRKIQKAPPMILTGLGMDTLLAKKGINDVRTFDWGEGTVYEGIHFIFSESRHRSGRWVHDQMKTLWGSFVIKSSYGNIYFAGDTGYGPHFKKAAAEHGGFLLSLLPIGAYEPRWFMKDMHLNPADAIQAHIDLRSDKSIGIHYGTFQLTSEGMNQPIRDLKEGLTSAGIDRDEFLVLAFGESLGISSK